MNFLTPFTKKSYYFISILFLSILCISVQSRAEIVEADYIPESGYWWPYGSGGLVYGTSYFGHPAPLERFDLLYDAKYPGAVTTWYTNFLNSIDSELWWGHCGDWAMAAVFEEVEIVPASINNIIYRVGDKKGILALAHNNDVLETADGTRPDVFHEWLLHYLKDESTAFVADLDPGVEAWNYPVYRYDMSSSVVGNTESVTVTIFYANSLVDPDIMGVDEKQKTYTYDLSMDGQGAITGGAWTGVSINEHPQNLYFPLVQGSTSPDLDYDQVLAIVTTRDDYLELNGQTVTIGPGTYNLILMDEDRYQVLCSSGDTLSFTIEKQEGSILDIATVVTDQDDLEISNSLVNDVDSLELLLECQNGPYNIDLSQSDYSDPNIYTLQVDMQRAVTQHVPHIPKNSMWTGFALTNTTDASVENVVLAIYDKEGAPIQTVLGPLDLAPGEKRRFLFDALPWWAHEYSSCDRVTLFSDSGVKLLNLFGDIHGSLACIVQGDLRGNRLIIPETIPPNTPGRYMSGKLLNESFEEAPITFRLYNQAGGLEKEVDEIVEKRGNFDIKPGFAPFNNIPDNGWIEIEGNVSQDLTAYLYLNESGGAKESLLGLPVNGTEKIVPHIPPPGYWITSLTLINASDVDNEVVCHLDLAGNDQSTDMVVELGPHAKTTIELQDNFGGLPGDPLFQSVLRLTGQQPFVGYYRYHSNFSQDDAKIPLVDASMYKKQLSLSHFPSESLDYWWTGICLGNPTSSSVTVEAIPYDYSGQQMDVLKGDLPLIELRAGAYDIFELESFLGDRAIEVSFLNFRVMEDVGEIYGFYLYGNYTMKYLAGANMQ